MREAVIVDCVRTAVGKAGRGALKNTLPDDLAAMVIQDLLKRHPQVGKADIDDVILGCAMPEGEAGLNLARIAALRAGLPDSVPGVTINRFCSSGLQSIAMAAERIRSGAAEIIVAGGAESMSMVPMTGNKFAAESLDGGSSAGDLHEHGSHGGASVPEIRDFARGSGSVRAGQSPEGAGGAGRGKIR